jgi:hypothetical protein
MRLVGQVEAQDRVISQGPVKMGHVDTWMEAIFMEMAVSFVCLPGWKISLWEW